MGTWFKFKGRFTYPDEANAKSAFTRLDASAEKEPLLGEAFTLAGVHVDADYSNFGDANTQDVAMWALSDASKTAIAGEVILFNEEGDPEGDGSIRAKAKPKPKAKTKPKAKAKPKAKKRK